MTKRRSHSEILAELVNLTDADVVDVGCGQGGLVRAMRLVGARPIGVECSTQLRSDALAADPDHADDYLDGVGQALPLETGSVDVVVYSYSLHHVPIEEMRNALGEARRVLRTGGTLYVLEPVPEGPGFEVSALVDDETHVRSKAQDALDAAPDLGLAPSASHRYVSESSYPSFDAYAHVVVGIDPDRAGRMEKVREQVREKFLENAEHRDGAFVFTTTNRLRIFAAI